MTSPAQQQAPNGYIANSVISDSVESTRDYMLNQWQSAVNNLSSNTEYYEATSRPDAIGIAVPPEMRKLLAQVGYPRLYINSVAERLEVEGFRLGDANEADTQLWDWWQANDLDVEATLGHTDALVHGSAFITISAPDPAIDLFVDQTVPIIRVEPPTSLYAEMETKTRMVRQAIRGIYDLTGSKIVAATLYLPMQTIAWQKDDSGSWVVIQQVPHNLGVVPVVPIANKTRLSDLTGSSEITPELRSVTDAAARILMNMQATAELMAVPQRLLFGVKPEDVGVDPATGQKLFDAYLARILAFEDADGKAQQFTAAELRNFGDALDQLDRKAAAYTGLPPQYLSFSSQNPASAEAIKSSEARLVKNAERKAKVFGGAWELAMRIAYAVMNGGMQSLPPQYYRMESVWRDPSTPTYAAKADAASKLYAAGAGVIPKERARIDMGYSIAERLEMQQWDAQENALLQLAGIYGPPPTVIQASEQIGAGAAATPGGATPPPSKPPAAQIKAASDAAKAPAAPKQPKTKP